MLVREIVEPIGQEMQDSEEIADDQGGIDDQLDQERRQSFAGFRSSCVLHNTSAVRSSAAGWPRLYGQDANIHCAARLSS